MAVSYLLLCLEWVLLGPPCPMLIKKSLMKTYYIVFPDPDPKEKLQYFIFSFVRIHKPHIFIRTI